jgi:hypothetical protein
MKGDTPTGGECCVLIMVFVVVALIWDALLQSAHQPCYIRAEPYDYRNEFMNTIALSLQCVVDADDKNGSNFSYYKEFLSYNSVGICITNITSILKEAEHAKNAEVRNVCLFTIAFIFVILSGCSCKETKGYDPYPNQVFDPANEHD